jgi:hypothetical protein
MTRFHLLYALVLIVLALGIYAAIEQGQRLRAPGSAEPAARIPARAEAAHSDLEPSASLFANLEENLQDPLSRLFIQLILIVFGARVCGALARRFGQAAVIGEMLAGIVLGPSLLGWVCPPIFHFVFPASSLGTLRLLS